MNDTARPAPGPLSVSDPWDAVSAGYAVEAQAVMGPFARDAITWVNPEPNARVLDVATGSGLLALQIAPRVAQVDAIDFSSAMLQQFELQRQTSNLTNVSAHLGDGQALPFADASYDAAFSMFGLMFFPDRLRGFRELFRVLKPGGVALVSSWAPVAQSPLMQLMFGALRAADPTRALPQTNLLSLENPELFGQELEQAGFAEVCVRPFTHALHIASAQSYWEAMVRSSAPLALLRQRLGDQEWERQSALAQSYIAQQLPGPAALETTAFFGLGRRP